MGEVRAGRVVLGNGGAGGVGRRERGVSRGIMEEIVTGRGKESSWVSCIISPKSFYVKWVCGVGERDVKWKGGQCIALGPPCSRERQGRGAYEGLLYRYCCSRLKRSCGTGSRPLLLTWLPVKGAKC